MKNGFNHRADIYQCTQENTMGNLEIRGDKNVELAELEIKKIIQYHLKSSSPVPFNVD